MRTPNEIYPDFDPTSLTRVYQPEKHEIRSMLDELYNGMKPYRLSVATAAQRADVSLANLKLAILGDSTEVGIGNDPDGASGNPYGMCRPQNNGGAWNMAFLSLMMAAPRFIAPSPEISIPLYGPFEPTSGPSASFYVPFDHHRLIVSASPSATFRVVQKTRGLSDKFTIYLLERTDPAAARFRVRLLNAAGTTVYADEVVDTYVAKENLLSTSQPVQGRIRAHTINLSAAAREYVIEITNVDVIARAEGTSSDGTAVICGFTFGSGIRFKNFAISSTTLKNVSDANTDKNITTDFVFNAAIAWGANAFVIGFGTNDSKTGVSDVASFKASLVARIQQVRAAVPKAKIILETAPRGKDGSIYQNNPAYNQVIRDVAIASEAAIVDREAIIDAVAATAYSDDVHPSEMMYTGLAEHYCGLFGVGTYWARSSLTQRDAIKIRAVRTVASVPQSETAGTMSDIISVTNIPRPAYANGVMVTAKVNLADTAAINAASFDIQLIGPNGAIVTLDTTVVSAALVSGTAIAVVTLLGVSEFSLDATTRFNLKLRGKNFRLRSGSDGVTSLTYQFV